MSKYTPTTEQVRLAARARMSDDRAAISAIVLEAMGDAWSDSEEYSALPGVVADLLLMSDWLAAEKAKWQAEAWERGYMFAFAQERGDHTHSRPVPDYLAEDIRSWNPHLTENGATR